MKIIISAQALVPWSGGSAFSEASLCGQMANRCDVTILCRRGSLDYAFAGSFGIRKVYEYEPREFFEAWRNREHWISRLFQGVDLVHLNGHWRWEDYFFARIALQRNIPYVLQPRGMLLVGQRSIRLKKIYNRLLGHWIVNHASKIISLSRFETEHYGPYRIHPKKIAVLPNGVSRTVVMEREDSLPSAIHKWTQSPYFLYLGRLEERKNLLFLVDVFHQYVREGGSANLLLVGPSERNHDERLEEKISKLGLGKRAFVTRAVYGKEKWEILKNSVAVLYPTLLEPFGRVPFESILGGALPIVPDASGSAEYLAPLLPACIYQHQDPKSLLSTMKKLENLSPQERIAMLEVAGSWVRSELNWEHIGERLMEIYEEVTSKKTSRRMAG